MYHYTESLLYVYVSSDIKDMCLDIYNKKNRRF